MNNTVLLLLLYHIKKILYHMIHIDSIIIAKAQGIAVNNLYNFGYFLLIKDISISELYFI